MRKALIGLATASLVAAGAGLLVPVTAQAAVPRAVQAVSGSEVAGSDDLPNPLAEKARALREEAVSGVLDGEADVLRRNGSDVVRLDGTGIDDDRYVELAREKTDRIFVVLAEFGNERHPNFPDQDTAPAIPGPATFEGPLRNAIPEPGKDDNTTIWQPDYDQKHFQDLYFGDGESLKTYYESQSSGRYSVEGTVTDWVKVPYNEARYGRSNGYPCAGDTCNNTWALVTDALNAWVADQKAAGKSDAQIKADVAEFDQWDRYDYDGDGDFNEPDGYIDHFQVVHAGGDQADGDPQQGEDAIWSHRWYVSQNSTSGPAGNRRGGTQIGTTGLWVGDYTIQPENGGLSVFAHEYGHDLGLPDEYDLGGGQGNANEWWTLMGQSRLGAKGEALGERPGDIGAWQKLQLGWLDYELVGAGESRTIELGPEEFNTADPQATVVVLPEKETSSKPVEPASGEWEWFSGTGNSFTHTLTRAVDLPAGSPQLTFQANWNIEDCGPDACDYAYVDINDGDGWDAIPGSITKAGEGNGIDGVSEGWQPATFDLSGYAGQNVQLRFRYVTDPAVEGQVTTRAPGFFVDDIAVAGVFEDGAETADEAWTADGFERIEGRVVTTAEQYYIAGYRSYVSYDQYLKTGPYNIGWASTKPDYAEHFPYQVGLLVSYWDTSYSNNSVSQHPGAGRNLYVDAHPEPIYDDATGRPFRTRVQMYDAPFGLEKTDSITLHTNGERTKIKKQEGNPVFDDTGDYFDEAQPDHGVKLPAVGVRIEVLKQDRDDMTIKVTNP
ncbi:immune inhibitor A domain-containing protein [Kineosporia babensis]|uniref:Immune inhibitor A n=1 Tax=Kineosporia babensis TaxID=499548 RepID=A0A9X1SS70_9ACTN|nr:immune inhibitor A domain-containing protein [Kineosporia babensis]MCD5310347.1 immune inhibitor A [Kineosporia babensis]